MSIDCEGGVGVVREWVWSGVLRDDSDPSLLPCNTSLSLATDLVVVELSFGEGAMRRGEGGRGRREGKGEKRGAGGGGEERGREESENKWNNRLILTDCEH